ncbi:sugar ABC transporter ATP-binding protein, partial [Allopusillimonas ginsengisoli]
MATSAYHDEVQKIYIAYYGRPADPVGLNFWAGKLDAAAGDLSEIIDAFGN